MSAYRVEPWLHFLVGRDPRYSALFNMLVWPHEVEPWLHSWCGGRVETLDTHI